MNAPALTREELAELLRITLQTLERERSDRAAAERALLVAGRRPFAEARSTLAAAETSLRQAAARALVARAPHVAARFRADADRIAALTTPATPATKETTTP